MGRLESLTALALGRGPYEDEVVGFSGDEARPNGQQYNGHGHPRNPETKRREREHVRAANEVMQVTGVVEDLVAAKTKASEYLLSRSRDTITGLRLMEAGRAVLVGGVWGVLGLRRRILLYQPYAKFGLLQILRYEKARYGLLHVIGAGLPAVLAYHAADWVAFFFETVLDAYWEEENEDGLSLLTLTPAQKRVRFALQMLHRLLLHYFALPDVRHSTAARPGPIFSHPTHPPIFYSLFGLFTTPTPSIEANFINLMGDSDSSIGIPDVHDFAPRQGDSMFAGMSVSAPTAEYDTPDRHPEERSSYRAEDEPTLRALEGLPALEQMEPHSRPNERDSDSSIGEDAEITHATLISFDVEATEAVDTPLGPLGTWSAELRSANEPRQSDEPRYRVTGLTMLPPILATEGLREIAAGLLVMPFEALMVRVIGRAYRASAGVDVEDIYSITSSVSGLGITGFGNLVAMFALQLGVTGIVWAGFTIGSQLWASRSHTNDDRGVVEI
ncbi:uncharacterized protein BP5553_01410 [Venustampulla echinocandica]|uniref:Uncharacterized protein n=1 Tax=Venustampulla echinocandica TaxID=2656787 RepID=A0A370U0Y0_9HELO|nr:uncharacterized protein BP5553_01410 [Venustampulla echinocandica]RDL41431.1 hypothetical protein BP5553_01410 [Venustampulla echinocandica]